MMHELFSFFAWFGMYFVTLMVIPPRKICRGLFTRYILSKIIPPKRWWKYPPLNQTYRYLIWAAITCPLTFNWPAKVSTQIFFLIFYGPMILVLLDDYIFGDDEWRKRFRSWSRNKIKWKMELPQTAPLK